MMLWSPVLGVIVFPIFFSRMVQVSSLQTHRKTLYLTFSPKCLPFAEVAQFYLAGKTDLEIGVDHNLLSMHPTLFIPKGHYS